jgi:hypothetical protein
MVDPPCLSPQPPARPLNHWTYRPGCTGSAVAATAAPTANPLRKQPYRTSCQSLVAPRGKGGSIVLTADDPAPKWDVALRLKRPALCPDMQLFQNRLRPPHLGFTPAWGLG